MARRGGMPVARRDGAQTFGGGRARAAGPEIGEAGRLPSPDGLAGACHR